jgi:small-conductance mechanosensitive channel
MKKTIIDWTEITLNSLNEFWLQIAQFLPKLIGAILIIIIGVIIAKLFSLIVKGVFKLKLLKTSLSKLSVIKSIDFSKVDIEKITSKFVYWIILLFFIISAFEVIGVPSISDKINAIINYLPSLISGLLLFIVGLYIAEIVRNAISGILKSVNVSGASIISNIIFYVIFLIVIITSLNQIGIETQLLTNNFTMIIGSVLVAFAISFGLGSKTVVTNILTGFYSQKALNVGNIVEIDDIKGEIVEKESTFIIIEQQDGTRVVVPNSKIYNSTVKIIK